jgi:hypothetical protein
MNTTKELFNLYESYLGIYEDLDEANRWERESGIGGNSPEAEMARMRSRAFHTGGVRSMKAVNPSDINSASLKVNRGVAQMIHKRNRGKSPTDPGYSHRKKIDPLKIPSYRESPLGLPKGYKDPLKPRTNNQNPNRVGDRVNANVKPLQTEVPTNAKSNIRKFQRSDVEYVLDYLIDEGYATDYDTAFGIFESMSDEWLDNIFEATSATRATVRGRVRVPGAAQRATAREDRIAAAQERAAKRREKEEADRMYALQGRQNPEVQRKKALQRTLSARMEKAAARMGLQ